MPILPVAQVFGVNIVIGSAVRQGIHQLQLPGFPGQGAQGPGIAYQYIGPDRGVTVTLLA